MMIDPMMTMDDQRILHACVNALPDDAVLVEYGSGGSTLMLAKMLRGSQSLFTIEHNVDWFHKVKTELRLLELDSRASITLRTPDGDKSIWPFGHYYEETPYACAEYIHADGVQIPWPQVQFVLVDGFVRGPVLAALATKLSSNVPVFLHDYPGREAWYDWAVHLYNVIARPTGSSPGYTEEGMVVPNSLLSLRTR